MAASGLLLCCGYVLGLLLSAIALSPFGIPCGSWVLGGAGLVAAGVMPRVWRVGPRLPIWLAAGVIGSLAVFYLSYRTPTPAADDVSLWLTQPELPTQVEVWGVVESSPRLTRSQKIQFELSAFQMGGMATPDALYLPKAVSGNVYVTVPLLWGTGLYPGQLVSVKGRLYAPQVATNPGGYDFRAYLARQGIFAGLNGSEITFPELEGRFRGQRSSLQAVMGTVQKGLWQIRRRIVRSQVQGLGVPEGPLVSAMLLGKGGVDVPYSVRDAFASVGLAHALAASGFQVSLLVSLLLRLTQRLPALGRLLICSGLLITYIGLTGIEASVLRAGIMGFAVLVAMTVERRPRPLGSLLLAAVILLIINPLWIWDLGFQLSFVATLALLVMVPGIMQRLDWMPGAIASLIAVPLAAYVWTMPLQLSIFGIVSPYSIALNVITAPLITVISLGSAIAGLCGLLFSPLGSWLSMVLYFPSHGLIVLAEWVAQLPGNNFATGTIALSQVLLLYGLYAMVWGLSQVRRYWWFVALICVGLVAIPAHAATAQQFQATILATPRHPILVLQKQGEVGILGDLDDRDAQFTVAPFLKKQGINRLSWAIALTPAPNATGWQRLLKTLPIDHFYTLPAASSETPGLPFALQQTLDNRQSQIHTLPLGTAIPIGSTPIRLLSSDPPALRFQLADQIWLWVDHLSPDTLPALTAAGVFAPAQVFGWSGDLTPADLTLLATRISPQTAIASATESTAEMQQWWGDRAITYFSTAQDGAIQWQPDIGFTRLIAQGTD